MNEATTFVNVVLLYLGYFVIAVIFVVAPPHVLFFSFGHYYLLPSDLY